jgi:SnoaL-like domain
MNSIGRLLATDEITQLKARYFRGVDSNDGELVRSILSEDCVLDYMGCCTDPMTKTDFIPAMNVVLRGRASWKSDGMASLGIVSVHQGHNFELEFGSDTTAKGIWSMTDRLYFPPGGAFSVMIGYGHYLETYEKLEQGWKLKTTRIKRIRVEVS